MKKKMQIHAVENPTIQDNKSEDPQHKILAATFPSKNVTRLGGEMTKAEFYSHSRLFLFIIFMNISTMGMYDVHT
jgi:hypothetical protein